MFLCTACLTIQVSSTGSNRIHSYKHCAYCKIQDSIQSPQQKIFKIEAWIKGSLRLDMCSEFSSALARLTVPMIFGRYTSTSFFVSNVAELLGTETSTVTS